MIIPIWKKQDKLWNRYWLISPNQAANCFILFWRDTKTYFIKRTVEQDEQLREYPPGKLLMVSEKEKQEFPLLEANHLKNIRISIYVATSCQKPVNSLPTFKQLMQEDQSY